MDRTTTEVPAMIPLIEANRDAIADLCRQYGVQKLAVFGSAVNGTWDPDHSDIDFLIDLGIYDPDVTWRLLGFGAAMEDLLGHRIDLVTQRSLKTPRFRYEVLSTMEVMVDDGDLANRPVATG
jgi:predicted nucleotidyltransferase